MCWKLIVIVFMGVLSMINAQISCNFDEGRSTHLKCSPGDEDYILRKGIVSDNSKTYSINLKGCRILDLNRDSFYGLPSLVNLDISLNGLKRLKVGVFGQLTNLKYLNLSHNLIIHFPSNLLDNIPSLLEFDLTGNHLSVIHPGAFKKISMLFLAKNTLQGHSLSPNSFGPSDINFLFLGNNNMENAPEGLLGKMRELNYLNLEECSLTVIPKFITTKNMNALVHLTFKGNSIRKITDVDTFNNLDDLRVLNLTKNLIEEINENALAPLKKLEKLDLSANRLKTVAEHQFQNTPALSVLDLSNNIISVLPVNAFRGTKLTELNFSDNKITYLQDNFCLELKNSGAVLKLFHFNRNPWQCACLRQLLREVKSMNVEYDAKNYDGGSPVCVTTSQFVCNRHEYDNKVYIDMFNSIQVPVIENM